MGRHPQGSRVWVGLVNNLLQSAGSVSLRLGSCCSEVSDRAVSLVWPCMAVIRTGSSQGGFAPRLEAVAVPALVSSDRGRAAVLCWQCMHSTQGPGGNKNQRPLNSDFSVLEMKWIVNILECFSHHSKALHCEFQKQRLQECAQLPV